MNNHFCGFSWNSRLFHCRNSVLQLGLIRQYMRHTVPAVKKPQNPWKSAKMKILFNQMCLKRIIMYESKPAAYNRTFRRILRRIFIAENKLWQRVNIFSFSTEKIQIPWKCNRDVLYVQICFISRKVFICDLLDLYI